MELNDSNIVNHLQTLENDCRTSITLGMSKYILTNWKQVKGYNPEGDTRNWKKVYAERSDPKYGSYMVCPETKEWRGVTISEFYGGAVVD